MSDLVVRERPILFSGAMVRAILSGEKTQTRRLMSPQPQESFSESYDANGNTIGRRSYGWCWDEGDCNYWDARGPEILRRCPHGLPGERLWVRESFAFYRDLDGEHPVYRADDRDHGDLAPTPKGWKSSRFMPRSVCRIVLAITGVRVQRLREITLEDLRAEGVAEHARSKGLDPDRSSRLASWIDLWDTVNPGHPWDTNPWIWTLRFVPIHGMGASRP